jgi:hypothetical protein
MTVRMLFERMKDSMRMYDNDKGEKQGNSDLPGTDMG